MVVPIVEAFSLSHAQVLNGSTTFLDAVAAVAGESEDIYGVNDASLDPDSDTFTNQGDDVDLSEWGWLNGADINVQAGYLSFPLIAALTGQTISSSGSGNAVVYGLDLWHEDAMNVAAKPMLLKMPSKDKDGAVRTLVIGLYKVNFRPITFDGPAYKEGLKVNYTARALYSDKSETGVAFADGKKRVGRLLSIA